MKRSSSLSLPRAVASLLFFTVATTSVSVCLAERSTLSRPLLQRRRLLQQRQRQRQLQPSLEAYGAFNAATGNNQATATAAPTEASTQLQTEDEDDIKGDYLFPTNETGEEGGEEEEPEPELETEAPIQQQEEEEEDNGRDKDENNDDSYYGDEEEEEPQQEEPQEEEEEEVPEEEIPASTTTPEPSMEETTTDAPEPSMEETTTDAPVIDIDIYVEDTNAPVPKEESTTTTTTNESTSTSNNQSPPAVLEDEDEEEEDEEEEEEEEDGIYVEDTNAPVPKEESTTTTTTNESTPTSNNQSPPAVLEDEEEEEEDGIMVTLFFVGLGLAIFVIVAMLYFSCKTKRSRAIARTTTKTTPRKNTKRINRLSGLEQGSTERDFTNSEGGSDGSPIIVIETDQAILEEGNMMRQRQQERARWGCLNSEFETAVGEEGEGQEVVEGESRVQPSMNTGTASHYGESTMAMSFISGLSQSAFDTGSDWSVDSMQDADAIMTDDDCDERTHGTGWNRC